MQGTGEARFGIAEPVPRCRPDARRGFPVEPHGKGEGPGRARQLDARAPNARARPLPCPRQPRLDAASAARARLLALLRPSAGLTAGPRRPGRTQRQRLHSPPGPRRSRRDTRAADRQSAGADVDRDTFTRRLTRAVVWPRRGRAVAPGRRRPRSEDREAGAAAPRAHGQVGGIGAGPPRAELIRSR